LFVAASEPRVFEAVSPVRHTLRDWVARGAGRNLEDPRVKRALDERFGHAEFDPDEPVVSPQSMFRDEQLVTVEEQ